MGSGQGRKKKIKTNGGAVGLKDWPGKESGQGRRKWGYGVEEKKISAGGKATASFW